tara:strand:- start:3374 stop:3583 length:210 start_codon:yes stop_codon:yes gene_type:complete
MKYYKSTYDECKAIVDRISAEYGYPKYASKTSGLMPVEVNSDGEYFFYIHSYWDDLTEEEKTSNKIYED